MLETEPPVLMSGLTAILLLDLDKLRELLSLISLQ